MKIFPFISCYGHRSWIHKMSVSPRYLDIRVLTWFIWSFLVSQSKAQRMEKEARGSRMEPRLLKPWSAAPPSCVHTEPKAPATSHLGRFKTESAFLAFIESESASQPGRVSLLAAACPEHPRRLVHFHSPDDNDLVGEKDLWSPRLAASFFPRHWNTEPECQEDGRPLGKTKLAFQQG